MNHIQRAISYITLGVSDLETMQDFYTALGFELQKNSDDQEHPYAMYKSGSVFLALYPKHLLAEQSGTDISGENSALSISLNVENKQAVDDLLLLVKEQKAEVSRNPFEAKWGGYCGYFKDPEGNLWEVVWNEGYQF
jgi:hypothetical protein